MRKKTTTNEPTVIGSVPRKSARRDKAPNLKTATPAGPAAPESRFNRTPSAGLLNAGEAARELGVKSATLYAYVSRGLLQSYRGEDPRSRFYRREEVLALKQRRSDVKNPERVAASALQWGTPVFDSAITLIEDGRLYYRGQDAMLLARHSSFEDVTALLWGLDKGAGHNLFGERKAPIKASWRRTLKAADDAHAGDRLHLVTRLSACEDFGAASLSPASVRRCGARLLSRFVMCASELRSTYTGSLAGALTLGFAPDRVELEPVVNAALVLCADHELNVSSFTGRCVASAGATPYDVVEAGLCALRGFRHGGHSDRVEALLSETAVRSGQTLKRQEARKLLSYRLQRGERLPGFGQPLYPDGDPRNETLLAVLEEHAPNSPILASARVLAEQAYELIARRPTIDFSLAVLAAELGRIPGGAFTLFAIGRTAGWVAHAIEEYSRGQLIRPRARYVGPAPSRAVVIDGGP